VPGIGLCRTGEASAPGPVEAVAALSATLFRELPEQSFGQGLGRVWAKLRALAALGRGDNQYLSRDPVVSLVRLAVDLAGYRLARRIMAHSAITSSDKNR